MSTLALVDELQRRDEAAAAALAEVESLQAETERARGRSGDLRAWLEMAPQERRRRDDAVAAAAARVGDAQAGLAQAEEELGRARERQREPAERAVAAARAALRDAVAELELAHEAAAALDRDTQAAEKEAAQLEAAAAATAERLARLPRLAPEARRSPDLGLAAVAAWAAQARGALLVLRASLAAERDAIVREANELGSAALGTALGATTVAHVRERVEHAGPP
jgi:predicted  nucleic acid-binding Zn-ribbon protein